MREGERDGERKREQRGIKERKYGEREEKKEW